MFTKEERIRIEDEFFNTFGIQKETVFEPGRDWDDDGLSSWYEEEVWPYIPKTHYADLLEQALPFISRISNNIFEGVTSIIDAKLVIMKFLTLSYQTCNEEEKEHLSSNIKRVIMDAEASLYDEI